MNFIINPETGEKIDILTDNGKQILKKYIENYKNGGSKRKNPFSFESDVDYKKIKTGPVEYTFNINPTIVNEIFNLMEDGNNDEPELVDYTDEFGTLTG